MAGINIELIKKDIKNLHLAVYPPDGRVRLAAPGDVDEKTLELYVISKIPWIRKQQRKFSKMQRLSPRQFVNRESHYFLGKRYLLRVHEENHPYRYPKVLCKTKTYIDLFVGESHTTAQKAELMQEWYRMQLKDILTDLLPKWEKILGVKARLLRVQTMRTKWGSCNTDTGNILLNIELAKKPMECIEYVLVHELLHLIERKHNDNFKAHLDTYFPGWERIKQELNEMAVG